MATSESGMWLSVTSAHVHVLCVCVCVRAGDHHISVGYVRVTAYAAVLQAKVIAAQQGP